ncbi:hypothetical protein ACFY1U_07215 [Streptomyces sp. NPDC001351]|uniref:hypothetical protein n=1 Tax=Streptomyces sp. NPDC001351 TaxID=3364564 RepID=UPI003699AAF5
MTVAGSKLVPADSARLYLWNGDECGVLRAVTVALLVLDPAWYAVLLVAEAVRPRRGYDVWRRAIVFPLGMTAAAVLSVAAGAVVAARAGIRSTAPR